MPGHLNSPLYFFCLHSPYFLLLHVAFSLAGVTEGKNALICYLPFLMKAGGPYHN